MVHVLTLRLSLPARPGRCARSLSLASEPRTKKLSLPAYPGAIARRGALIRRSEGSLFWSSWYRFA
eukprot:975120-Pyramimonas_sp.AAC.1